MWNVDNKIIEEHASSSIQNSNLKFVCNTMKILTERQIHFIAEHCFILN